MAENYDPVIFSPEALEQKNIYSNKIDKNGKFQSFSIFVTPDNDYFLHKQFFSKKLPPQKNKTPPKYKRPQPIHLTNVFPNTIQNFVVLKMNFSVKASFAIATIIRLSLSKRS